MYWFEKLIIIGYYFLLCIINIVRFMKGRNIIGLYFEIKLTIWISKCIFVNCKWMYKFFIGFKFSIFRYGINEGIFVG